MRTKVLITGVAGFIGSNLAKMLLDKGFEVVGIDNLSAGTLENIPSGVDFQQLDIRNKGIYPFFEGMDTVFHLAAKNCLIDCLNNPLETSDINVTGTVNVLEASRQAKVRKFIYADTSAEYEGVAYFPSKVDKTCPLGTYAVSKSAGAGFCRTYQNLWQMNITILRYFNVYGPVQDWRRVVPPVMSGFIIKMLKGEQPVIYGTGEKRRDFIYVDDVNEFHLLAMQDSKTDGKVYNIGSGVNYSVNEVFELIEGILNSGLKPIYKDELPGEAEITLADISDSIALGWKPKIEVEEGLKRSIEYIKEKVV
ncbi:MAG: NAD-dependent epimerase/dehydratase family protein [Nitrospirota bacterium]